MRARGAWLGERGPLLRTHVVSGLRARFDETTALQREVGLEHRRYTHALLPAEATHRRNTIAGPQRAALDHRDDALGDLLVKVRRDPRHEIECSPAAPAEGSTALRALSQYSLYGSKLYR